MNMDDVAVRRDESPGQGGEHSFDAYSPSGAHPPRYRLFKPNATYLCNREGLVINGDVYSVGDRINTRELSLARLRTLFDAGFIEPVA